MAETLALKYRPFRFSDVVGQEAATAPIRALVSTGRASGAFLFIGPRGVGKTTVARILAAVLNCEATQDMAARGGEPCGVCGSCVQTREGRHFGVLEMDAASKSGIDNVRETIISGAQLAPMSGRVKVFILDEVHALSKEAFQALLKTLEEPPGECVFILITTDAQKVPATVSSRCKKFLFRAVPAVLMEKRLETIAKQEGYEISPKGQKIISWSSTGALRDAVMLLEQGIALAKNKIISDEDLASLTGAPSPKTTLAIMEAIVRGQGGQALNFLSDLLKSGASVEQVLAFLSEEFNGVLREKFGASSNGIPGWLKEKRSLLAGLVTREFAIKMVTLASLAEYQARTGLRTDRLLDSLVASLAMEQDTYLKTKSNKT